MTCRSLLLLSALSLLTASLGACSGEEVDSEPDDLAMVAPLPAARAQEAASWPALHGGDVALVGDLAVEVVATADGQLWAYLVNDDAPPSSEIEFIHVHLTTADGRLHNPDLEWDPHEARFSADVGAPLDERRAEVSVRHDGTTSEGFITTLHVIPVEAGIPTDTRTRRARRPSTASASGSTSPAAAEPTTPTPAEPGPSERPTPRTRVTDDPAGARPPNARSRIEPTTGPARRPVRRPGVVVTPRPTTPTTTTPSEPEPTQPEPTQPEPTQPEPTQPSGGRRVAPAQLQ